MSLSDSVRVSAARGFTLVEVMIALVLSSILIGLVFSGLRTYVRASDVVEVVIDGHNRDLAVSAFVRSQLRQAVPLTIVGAQAQQILFVGEPGRLGFIGYLPSHRAAGGLFFNTFEVRSRRGVQALVFEYRRLPVGNQWLLDDLLDLEPLEAKVLLGTATQVHFEYFGADEPTATPAWHAQWDNSQQLPTLIRLRVTSADKREIITSVALPTRFVEGRIAQLVQAGVPNRGQQRGQLGRPAAMLPGSAREPGT